MSTEIQRPDIEAIRQRARIAIPGPWRWGGNADHLSVRLIGRDRVWGSTTVLAFQRWGMQSAQPVFCMRSEEGRLRPAANFLVYEVCPEATRRDDPRVYRGDIIDINHPDAQFIAHARQDIDDLLAYIEQLESRS